MNHKVCEWTDNCPMHSSLLSASDSTHIHVSSLSLSIVVDLVTLFEAALIFPTNAVSTRLERDEKKKIRIKPGHLLYP